jgi:Cys-tRNA(Pro)/Cys-tRNA(Cys) deacylase
MPDLHPKIAALIAPFRDQLRVYAHADFPQPIGLPDDFAAVLGYDPRRIAKTVLMGNRSIAPERRLDTPDSHYAMACLSATDRIDMPKLAEAAGWARAEMATANELAASVGYPIGSVSPLAVGAIRVYLASNLSRFDTILIGGGRAGIEVELSPALLAKLAAATLLDIGLPRGRRA